VGENATSQFLQVREAEKQQNGKITVSPSNENGPLFLGSKNFQIWELEDGLRHRAPA
jgi:hypothetical protein